MFFEFPIFRTKEELSCNQLMLLDNGILYLRKLSAGYKLLSFLVMKIREVVNQNECITLARCHTRQQYHRAQNIQNVGLRTSRSQNSHITRGQKRITRHTEPDPSPFARPPEKVHRLPDIIIIPIRHQALSTPGIERFSYSQGELSFSI